MRVPFIVRWPGVVQPGTTSSALVSTIDVLPTLIDVTSAESGRDLQLDGRSLLPLLKRDAGVVWRNAYCDTYDMIYLGDDGEQPHMRMIRTDRWKLIYYPHIDRMQLFDLLSDPHEVTDRSKDPASAKVVSELRGRLLAWQKEVGDPLVAPGSARKR